MKVFLISNGEWEFDGRLRELVKVASGLGSVKYVTRVQNNELITEENHIKLIENNYLKFIFKSFLEGLRYKDMDILIIDNRKAIIPALLLKLFNKPKKIVIDVRELYLLNEVKHFVGKLGCLLEGIMIKRADVVICANKYRAELMQRYYHLNTTPLVYENLRKLDYSNEFDYEKLNRKYNYIFSKDSFKVISTSGYSVSRTNDILAGAIAELGNDYELLLVGGGTEKDKKIIRNIVKSKNLTNIHIIEKVQGDELKFLISNSHLGIVNYHQEDKNNSYCASGKIYEFILEGIPVVTTENKPLLDLVNTNHLGISDNQYIKGINQVKDNYNYYKLSVKNYINSISIEKNNSELKNKLIYFLKK